MDVVEKAVAERREDARRVRCHAENVKEPVMRTHLLRMADDLDEQGDMLQVNLQLTWIRRDLEEGNPVSEDRWLTLGENYLREEEAYRKAGVDEETLQRNRHSLIDDFLGISEEAGQKLRRTIEP